MSYISSINFLVNHIYREENFCADILANIGLSLNTSVLFDTIPLEARAAYVHNRLGLPNFRFSFA